MGGRNPDVLNVFVVGAGSELVALTSSILIAREGMFGRKSEASDKTARDEFMVSRSWYR